jgi:hypothetical protein
MSDVEANDKAESEPGDADANDVVGDGAHSQGNAKKTSGSLIVVLLAAMAVLLVGAYVLWDMKPWTAKRGVSSPTNHLQVLGRDDPATLDRERENRVRHLPSRGTSASASSAPSGSAAPASSP